MAVCTMSKALHSAGSPPNALHSPSISPRYRAGWGTGLKRLDYTRWLLLIDTIHCIIFGGALEPQYVGMTRAAH